MRTIAAIATPSGTGAIGIIRISGDCAAEIADKVFSGRNLKSFHSAEPGKMYIGDIVTDTFSENCLAVFFKAPKSYTGEDLVELYCHGGEKLLNGILSLIIKAGAYPAENGEFTKKAFLNGKMALSDAEGVIDMINAESEAAINAGYRLMSGKLTSEIRQLTDKLQAAISGMEASLDYPEEMEEDTREEGKRIIGDVFIKLKTLSATAERGKMIKYGINVAITGLPNVGKSSLLNAILKDDRAIVSDIPGTTRDTVSESVDYKGIKINFVDTAGIRESKDEIEKKGVERTYKAIKGADIVIRVLDATDPKEAEKTKNKTVITVYNKSDIAEVPEGKFGISAKTGEGVEKLLDQIVELTKVKSQSGEVITNLRHLDAIERAAEHLKRAIEEFDNAPTDCILIDIKAAFMALGEIDGSTASDKIIDEIFRRFCVGK